MDDASPADRIVTMRRTFPIDRARLFRAWTDPGEFAKWWGPRGWTVERCDIDVRPDGRWTTRFRLPDGGARAIGGTYLEVAPPERLVFTWDPAPEEGAAAEPSVVTLEFHARDDGTELLLTHRKLTTGRAVDMDAGWANTFDSLDDYVRGATETGDEGASP